MPHAIYTKSTTDTHQTLNEIMVINTMSSLFDYCDAKVVNRDSRLNVD